LSIIPAIPSVVVITNPPSNAYAMIDILHGSLLFNNPTKYPINPPTINIDQCDGRGYLNIVSIIV